MMASRSADQTNALGSWWVLGDEAVDSDLVERPPFGPERWHSDILESGRLVLEGAADELWRSGEAKRIFLGG